MSTPIASISDVTSDWLTDRLKQCGALPAGSVLSFTAETSHPFQSSVSKLRLRYSSDAPVDAPACLFLKIYNPRNGERIEERGKREIDFYRLLMTVVPAMSALPVPRCYDAVFSSATGVFHLLMDDLSETHEELPRGLHPLNRQCEQAVDTLARMHACWWNHPDLGVKIGQLPADEQLKSWHSDDLQHYQAMAAEMGDRLSPLHRQIYEAVLDTGWQRQSDRYAGSGFQHITLCHGDAHTWNFVYPRPESAGLPAYLIDWEAVGIGCGTDDLAYMMTLFWFPERRARLEMPLLRRYHAGLIQYGITGYTREKCQEDYRHSVIKALFAPIFWWWVGMPVEVWWDRMERVMLAYLELHCEDLLR